MVDAASSDQLDQDLRDAQERGRWLSEDEQRRLDQEREQQEQALRQQQSRRSRLMVLTAICCLLPPFWPLAFALSCYLLFPETVARIGVVAGVVLVGAVVATVGLLVALVHALLQLLG